MDDEHRSTAIDQQVKEGKALNRSKPSFSFESELQSRKNEYLNTYNLKISICTWNLNGKDCDDSYISLLKSASQSDNIDSDIYAIGFQEMVVLSAGTVLVDSFSSERANQWTHRLFELLNSDDISEKYDLIKQTHLVGIYLVVFVKSKYIEHITNIDFNLTPVGFYGNLGNKGSCSVRLQIYDTSICFVCAHFEAPRSKYLLRNQNYNSVITQTNFLKSAPHTVQAHDYAFFFGDLNYRIEESVTHQEIIEKLDSNDLDWLLDHDQLAINKEQGLILKDFIEEQILFKPTYKFIQGTDEYENRPNKPKRPPAWCDRIFYFTKSSNQQITSMSYNSYPNIKISDHKPLFLCCQIIVEDMDKEKNKEIRQELLNKLSLYENLLIPNVTLKSLNVVFPPVPYNVSSIGYVQLMNTGEVPAEISILSNTCQWAKFIGDLPVLQPYETYELPMEAKITSDHLDNDKPYEYEDIIVIHVENGNDLFITLSIDIFPTRFGLKLHNLMSETGSVRDVSISGNSIKTNKITKFPLCLMNLYKAILTSKDQIDMSLPINEDEVNEIRDAFDNSQPLDKFSGNSLLFILLEFSGCLGDNNKILSNLPSEIPQLKVDKYIEVYMDILTGDVRDYIISLVIFIKKLMATEKMTNKTNLCELFSDSIAKKDKQKLSSLNSVFNYLMKLL